MKEPTKFSCGKASYNSRQAAKKAMKRINQKFGTNGLKAVYFCDICLAWHTTSLSKKRSRSLTRKLKSEK